MRYIIIDKKKATSAGIDARTALARGDKIIVNENTLLRCPHLTGTLEDRASELDGVIYTNEKIKQIIKTEKYGKL